MSKEPLIVSLAVEAREQSCSPKKMLEYFDRHHMIGHDIEGRLDVVLDRLPRECQQVFFIVGILDAPTIPIDLIYRLTPATSSNLEKMREQGLLRIHLDMIVLRLELVP